MRPWFLVVFFAAPALAADSKPTAAAVEFFETKVRPVFVEKCLSCHGDKKQSGGLRLDSKASVLKGGEHGPAIVPGKASDSLLVKAIRHEGELKMPPKGGKLPTAVVADFVQWIEAGADDPRDGSESANAIDWKKAREFWAFKPVVKPPVPDGPELNPIDRFVRGKLTEKGLAPAGLTDQRTLIRRVTFDLTGLPPKPVEVDSFLNDNSAEAFAKLVDRLLASPAYGEMQARHWLDVARYAEDQAHTFAVKPYTDAWRYRDWVIRAFNDDLPFDRFVKYQIAADLILGDAPDEIGHRAALGFFGLGAQYYKNSDAAKAAADELDDRVDTLTRGFLGLTVSCARCHDHKFDPIPTADYYSLAGVFASTKLADVPLAPKAEVDRVAAATKLVQDAAKRVKDFLQTDRDRLATEKADALPHYILAAWRLEARRLDKSDAPATELAKAEKLDAPALDRLTRYLGKKQPAGSAMSDWGKHLPKKPGAADPPDEVKNMAELFRDQVKAAIAKPAEKPKADLVQAVFGEAGVFPLKDADVAAAMPADRKAGFERIKSEHAELAKKAPPPVASAHGLNDMSPVDLKVYLRGNPARPGDVAPRRFLRIMSGDEPARFTQGSGRKELAEAIANPRNPLTARVFVNRIWQQHFGRGIVGTPSNFGNLGERPTHPELLDWLAATFVESGGSVKALHRQIVLSNAYQRAVVADTKNEQIDPDNRYLWRASRRRLSVEAWRDALLAVSGRLDPALGGTTTNLDSADNARRTVYAKISRHELNGLLRLFDFPDANITSERRVETTVPQQQLFVLNSPFMVAQAKAFAARLESEGTDDGRVRRAYELAFGRPATEDEVSLGVRYLNSRDGADVGQNKLNRRERYCQALLASNEFLYLD
jgi:cytochrome c553/mono/diheme cytochrome c family protein